MCVPGCTEASTKPSSDFAERSGATWRRRRPAYRPPRRGSALLGSLFPSFSLRLRSSIAPTTSVLWCCPRPAPCVRPTRPGECLVGFPFPLVFFGFALLDRPPSQRLVVLSAPLAARPTPN